MPWDAPQADSRWRSHGCLFTQDPIGLAGGVNLYAYAGNNPIAFSDPFGLCPPCLPLVDPAIAFQYRPIDRQWVLQKSHQLAGRTALIVGGVQGATGLAKAGIASLAKGGTSAAVEATFFRGVSAAEARDVAATGTLRAGAAAAGNTGKYLTNTAEAAAQWGAQNGPGSQVLQITVQADATKTFTALGRMDGIGQAWWAPIKALEGPKVEMIGDAVKAAATAQ